jgi:hypothetical protein
VRMILTRESPSNENNSQSVNCKQLQGLIFNGCTGAKPGGLHAGIITPAPFVIDHFGNRVKHGPASTGHPGDIRANGLAVE